MIGVGVGLRRRRFGGGGFSGLLDEYSGAAAAYSLRQLSSTSTNAIRVRRLSDNTETNIGFVDNELDTSTLSTFCSGTNGFVTTWYDQSGNGNDVTQSTASNQPKIYDSVSGVIEDNGKPSVQFDGSNDSFDMASAITTSIYSNFAVIKKQITNSVGLTIGLNNGMSIGAWSDGNIYENNGSSFVYTPYTNDTNQNLFSVIKSGNNSSDFSANQNGVTLPPFTGSGFNSISFIYIGTRNVNWFDGNIQEIVIYTSDESSNRTGIETNINDFYSIYL
jgi:hypothetical protein